MRALVISLLGGAACACHSGSLDRTNTPTSDDVKVAVEDVPVHGHQVRVRIAGAGVTHVKAPSKSGKSKHRKRRWCLLEGELLAMDDEQLWLATSGHVVFVPLAEIESVDVWLYRPYSGYVWGWTGLGALSTLSHGFFLILTMPAWFITGGSTAASSHMQARAEAKPDDYWMLRQFARYPQGPSEAWYRRGLMASCKPR